MIAPHDCLDHMHWREYEDEQYNDGRYECQWPGCGEYLSIQEYEDQQEQRERESQRFVDAEARRHEAAGDNAVDWAMAIWDAA